MNSASPPEAAACFDEVGSIFTLALIELFGAANESLDINRDGIVSWEEFGEELSKSTARDFVLRRRLKPSAFRAAFGEQESQTVKVYQLPQTMYAPIPRSTQRLGLNVFDTNGQGVLIRQVLKDSLAEWAGLRPNEILYQSDDRRINNEQDFGEFVKNALPGTLHTLWVRNNATGESRAVKLRLGTQPQTLSTER